jgi:nucleoside-diphosphate-sugar epimerase
MIRSVQREKSMKVIVTGGSGKLGQFVVADLAENGHEVVSVDQRLPADRLDRVHYRVVNLMNIGEIAGAMKGCDAAVHLGAIPNPYGHADEVVFVNNTQATFNVFQSASLLGIKKLATASSVSAYGAAWSPTPLYPRYAPIDEDHPMDNHDAYGLSKEVDERTALMFCRRDGMQIAALRFHWVGWPDEVAAIAEGRDEQWLADSAKILWGYVDVRDAAAACRLAIEADFGGFEPFNIVASDTQSTVPTEKLLRTYTPGTEIRSPLPGTTGCFVTAKAKQLLGWGAVHGWR